MRMVVVFPAPFRPRSPVIVPRRTVNETPSTARTAPNVLTTSRTSNTTDMRRQPFSRNVKRLEAAYCTWGGGLGLGVGGSGIISNDDDPRQNMLDHLDDALNRAAWHVPFTRRGENGQGGSQDQRNNK